jgi:hypothetical protein
MTDPLSCLTVFQDARTQLEIAQNNVIQLELSTYQMLQDSISSGADANVIAANQDVYDTAHQVRIDHTDLVNQFNAKIQTLSYIPGFSALFLGGGLSGLRNGRLGQVPVPWLLAIRAIAQVLIMVAVAWVIGDVVNIWTGNYEVAVQKAKTQASCYAAYKEALAHGQTPPDCTSITSGSSTPFLIIGGVIVAAMLLMRN